MADITINPDEIRDALKDFAKSYDPGSASTAEIGHVVDAADGIAHVEGLQRAGLLSLEEAEQISAVMRENWGGGWRLPTVKELKGLIQKNVEAPKIDGETFPNTHQGSYWTSDQSFYTDQYFWTVNFYTGQLYNRFFYFQENAVRLVRDYSIN
mgnify:CR=1 FL=1